MLITRRWLSLGPQGSLHMSVRNLGGFEPHSYDHQKDKGRDPPMHLEKLRITVPVPVQTRALKRHRNPKNIAAALDREKLKQRKVIISSKRPELNHRMAQQYGTFDKLPLVSAGWYHRKSVGDHFTINPFQPLAATNFDETNPKFADYPLDERLVKALNVCGFTKATNIQHEAIPKMLEYRDNNTLIAAETGNGKTLAFLIPMLNQLLHFKDAEETEAVNSPYAVIVTPGRELADQVGEVAECLGSELGLRVRVHKGGQIRKQILQVIRMIIRR